MGKIYHSEAYLGANKKNYFEGWYFRHAAEFPFAFIVGISKCAKDRHSFIQYIDSKTSHYFRFEESALCYDEKDMTITVAGNVFSLLGIRVDLTDGNVRIKAEVRYSDITEFGKSVYAPSVMGPFAYLPMPCNHAVISMRHNAEGTSEVNGVFRKIKGVGYIEKDFGRKFPENYFWTHIAGDNLSVMCAVAWPIVMKMKGFLCLVSTGGKQYNFSLYSGARIKEFTLGKEKAELRIVKGKNSIAISAASGSNAQKLVAPDTDGAMRIEIAENLLADLQLRLTLDGKEIDTTAVRQCAFESVLK